MWPRPLRVKVNHLKKIEAPNITSVVGFLQGGTVGEQKSRTELLAHESTLQKYDKPEVLPITFPSEFMKTPSFSGWPDS